MEVLAALVRALSQFTLAYGVIGLAVGAFLESLGIPTASLVVDLTAGLLIINNRTTFLEAVIITDAGLVAGSLVSFYLGRGGSRLLRYFNRDNVTIEMHRFSAKNWIERYGDKAVFFGQLFGPTRTWISFPAGAMGMDVKKFVVYTALGGALYSSIVIALSWLLTSMIGDRLASIAPAGYSSAWLIALSIVPLTLFAFHRMKKRRSRMRKPAPLE